MHRNQDNVIIRQRSLSKIKNIFLYRKKKIKCHLFELEHSETFNVSISKSFLIMAGKCMWGGMQEKRKIWKWIQTYEHSIVSNKKFKKYSTLSSSNTSKIDNSNTKKNISAKWKRQFLRNTDRSHYFGRLLGGEMIAFQILLFLQDHTRRDLTFFFLKKGGNVT